jgi:MFS superfamily sulfate permease-like transporter
MESNATTGKSRDILSSAWRVFFLYWLPVIAIVVAGAPAISSGWRTAVWTVALTTMGVACLVNALRCGRVHCYLTGPFFLLMAVGALSYGLGILRLGGNRWNLLGLITVIGAIALWCLPEMYLGKYRKGL